jgi:hypothetical protein
MQLNMANKPNLSVNRTATSLRAVASGYVARYAAKYEAS